MKESIWFCRVASTDPGAFMRDAFKPVWNWWWWSEVATAQLVTRFFFIPFTVPVRAFKRLQCVVLIIEVSMLVGGIVTTQSRLVV